MTNERVLPIKAPIANITMKRVGKVRFLMFYEVRRVCTTEVADIAPVRFLACMCAAVDCYHACQRGRKIHMEHSNLPIWLSLLVVFEQNSHLMGLSPV